MAIIVGFTIADVVSSVRIMIRGYNPYCGCEEEEVDTEQIKEE